MRPPPAPENTEAALDIEVSQIDPLIAEHRAARERWRGARTELLRRIEADCRGRWPAAFRVPRPPLMVGVREKMIEAGIEPGDAEVFLAWWCTRPDYFDALAHGEPRVDLDGTPVGLPRDRDRYLAAVGCYGRHKAREVLARIDARQAEATATSPQEVENAAD